MSRTVVFGLIAVGVVAAEQRVERPTADAEAAASAAVSQASSDRTAAARLERLRQQTASAELTAAGVVLLAAAACFGTWRTTPKSTILDRRTSAPVA